MIPASGQGGRWIDCYIPWMPEVAGPYFAAALLLAVGGALKASRPHPTARAVSALGLPSSATAVRLGGVFEVGVGAGAVLVGGRVIALLVAFSYLVFAAFVAAALVRRVPLSSCGCFGEDDTPPTAVHLAVNLAAALVAGLVALEPLGGLGSVDVMGDGPLLQAVFVVSTAVTAYLTYAALTALPRLTAATSGSRGHQA